MTRFKCHTFEDWFFGAYRNDEFNLILSGWFLWNADEAAEMIYALREFQEGE